MPKRNHSFDGLRALAIAAVIGYHADIVWLPGGFLGVEVFFVLSGYLIGGTLFTELERSGRVQLTSYLSRRVRRLAPALLTMLGVTAAVVLLRFPDQVGHLRRGAIGGVTGSGNWLDLYFAGDYFAQFGRGPILRHLWSFSVEVQAYLLLPILIPAIWRIAEKSRALAATLLGGLGLMAYIWQAIVALHPNGAPRAYFGTDTRIGAILFGAALAAVQPERFTRYVRRQPTALIGFLCLVGLGFAAVRVDGTDANLYQGILAATAALTVLVIAASSGTQTSSLSRVLSAPPLRWIGTRSYGLYLWHWPIFVFTRPIAGVPMSWLGFVARVAAASLLAEVSFRWIEGGSTLTTRVRIETRRRLGLTVAVCVSIALAFGVATASPARLVASDDPQRLGLVVALDVTSIPTTVAPVTTLPATTSPLTTLPPLTVFANPTSVSQNVGPLPDRQSGSQKTILSATVLPETTRQPDAFEPDTTVRPSILASDLTLIGDSVMRVAERSLTARLGPGYVLDTEVGRQFPSAMDRVAALRAEGLLYPVVVIGLGTNGPFRDKEIDALIAELGDRRTIAFVKVEVPRRWKNSVNEALDRAKQRHPEIVVIDWPLLVEEQGLTLSDGVHPAPKAAAAYTDLLLKSVVS